MRKRRATAMLAGMLLAAGCTSDVLTEEPERPPNLDLVAYSVGVIEIEAESSPEDLIVARADAYYPELAVRVIVTGAVESVEQGRNVYSGDDEQDLPGPQPAAQHIVLEVKVDEALRAGEPGDIHDGRVYVDLWQGGSRPAANGANRPMFTLEEWREALPPGTRVMLFLLQAYDGKGAGPIEYDGRGVPNGATLLQPDPQGLIFEHDGRLVADEDGTFDVASYWKVDSIAEISARVKRHLAKTG